MANLDLRRKAELLRTLAHPLRLAMLEELGRGAKCVTDIQDLLDVAQPNISQHLKALRREQIVDFCEDGNLRCYYITRPTLVKALTALLAREHKVVNRSADEVRREGKRREAQTVSA
jgi:ArsR family transcriptional regulator, arsenate/arsenite/antimonite-responsive transcriptional repressor